MKRVHKVYSDLREASNNETSESIGFSAERTVVIRAFTVPLYVIICTCSRSDFVDFISDTYVCMSETASA